METDSFQVDIKDDRFSRLYTDHSFGIDLTSSEFKKTSAMIQVVKTVSEQRQQRMQIGDERESDKSIAGSAANGGSSSSSSNVQSLVNRLKRKFKDN